jgi:hypothetical protein
VEEMCVGGILLYKTYDGERASVDAMSRIE